MAKKTVNDKDAKTKAQKEADLAQAEGEHEAQAKAEAEAKAKAKADSTGTVHFVSQFKRYRLRGHQFEGNRFSTDDPAVIEQLRSSKAYGNEFTEMKAAG